MDTELLAMLKKSIGRMDAGTTEDDYYQSHINLAKTMLAAEDISQTVMNTDLGKHTIVLIAKASMQDQDIANNSTITMLRNELSALTKGERANANR